MRHILTSVVLVVLLFPSLALGETVKFEDLIVREGLHYKKFTDVPFSGKTTGKIQGTFKNGVKDGPWVGYNKDGTVNQEWTRTYKDGEKVK
jgi:antitoxin component YwqK of YwqJK toxin-antitoxin module